MIAKVFKGGRTSGGARAAIKYLLDERQHEGTARVVKGDPATTQAVIDTLETKWKFTSGVLSFEEPNIPEERKQEVIADFERVMLAGLEEHQFNSLWVEHTDKNRLELHYMIPRVELSTGKALAVYTHARDLKKKDLFQTYWNAELGLSSPHEQNTLQGAKTKWSSKRQEIAEQIDALVSQGVAGGTIQNRADVVDFLRKDLGLAFSRLPTKKGMTVQVDDKKIRLKGAFYGEDFRSVAAATAAAERAATEYTSRGATYARDDTRRARHELDEQVRKHASENVRRYPAAAARARLHTAELRASDRLVLGHGDIRHTVRVVQPIEKKQERKEDDSTRNAIASSTRRRAQQQERSRHTATAAATAATETAAADIGRHAKRWFGKWWDRKNIGRAIDQVSSALDRVVERAVESLGQAVWETEKEEEKKTPLFSEIEDMLIEEQEQSYGMRM